MDNKEYTEFTGSSLSYRNTVKRDGEAFIKGFATGKSGFGFNSSVSFEEKSKAQENCKNIIKELRKKLRNKIKKL